MCLKGVEQQDGMANTHYIEDSKKVIFAMRARRRKWSSIWRFVGRSFWEKGTSRTKNVRQGKGLIDVFKEYRANYGW